MFLPGWTYDGDDPGLKLFTLANPLLPPLAEGSILYEIGAKDTDWIERVQATAPSLAVRGIDWREVPRPCVDRGDARVAPLPCAHGFFGLSSIEHIGLGNYERDPMDPYGDVKVMQRLRDHLLPGGFIYLDVPYAPEGYFVYGTKCRVYDDQSLLERFGPHEVLGYTDQPVSGWIPKPATNCTDPRRPFYYVALLVRKDGATN